MLNLLGHISSGKDRLAQVCSAYIRLDQVKLG